MAVIIHRFFDVWFNYSCFVVLLPSNMSMFGLSYICTRTVFGRCWIFVPDRCEGRSCLLIEVAVTWKRAWPAVEVGGVALYRILVSSAYDHGCG